MKIEEIKPYDYDVAEAVFTALFKTHNETTDDLTEIPAASYQLVKSALEWMAWEVTGQDREDIKAAMYVVERLRDKQKMCEFKRKHNKN